MAQTPKWPPIKVLKVGVVSGGGAIQECDAIKYDGKLWLVPQWLDEPGRGTTKPRRIIRIVVPHQPMTNPAFWFGFHPPTPAKSCSRRCCYARASSAVRDRRTAGDRNSDAATTGKTELDDSALHHWPQASPSPTLLDGGAARSVATLTPAGRLGLNISEIARRVTKWASSGGAI